MTDTNTSADLSASEDFAAFEASIDNPTTPEIPAAEAAPEEKAPDPAESPEGEGEADPTKAEGEEGEQPADPAPKPKKTAQQRIDELTWRAAEAERREQEARDRLEAALTASKPAPAPRSADDAPDPNDYEFGEEDAAYIRDVTRFETKRELQAEFQAQEAQRETERAMATARQAFDARKAQAFPDGETEGFKAFCAIEKVPVVLNDVIMISDVGPQLAAHYGDNPADLQRLSALPLHLQAYEIAKVEGRLTAPTAPATAETPKPQPKIATDAPSPAPQVRGSGGQFKVSPDTDDFAAFDKAY